MSDSLTWKTLKKTQNYKTLNYKTNHISHAMTDSQTALFPVLIVEQLGWQSTPPSLRLLFSVKYFWIQEQRLSQQD